MIDVRSLIAWPSKERYVIEEFPQFWSRREDEKSFSAITLINIKQSRRASGWGVVAGGCANSSWDELLRVKPVTKNFISKRLKLPNTV